MIYTRAELLERGLTNSGLVRRIKAGTLERVLPGVYSTEPVTPWSKCLAVTRWEPRAVLCHQTAAWLYGWTSDPTGVEITVPPAVTRHAPKWLHVYRRVLPELLVGERQDLPVTVPEQTILDCLSAYPGTDFEAVLDNRFGLDFDRDGLRAIIAANPGRSGNQELRRQLALAAPNTLSEPERLLARAFRERGSSIPSNVPIGPYVGDFVDEGARIVVEVDGRAAHSERVNFVNDRRRQNWLVRNGWLVLRYAASVVLDNPGLVADEVLMVLAERKHRSS